MLTYNLLVAEVQTKEIKSKENNVKQVMEQKFSQIDGITGSIEDNWGKVKEILLDILNNNIDKMEIYDCGVRYVEESDKRI